MRDTIKDFYFLFSPFLLVLFFGKIFHFVGKLAT